MNKKSKPEPFDEENPEWDASTFTRARTAREVLPTLFDATTAERLLRPRGRPRATRPKERINIRLSQDVLAHFKAAGAGWQTRIDAALRQFIAQSR